jgi:hypothetical protein
MVSKKKSMSKMGLKSKEKNPKATKAISDDKPINDYKKGAKMAVKDRKAFGNKR